MFGMCGPVQNLGVIVAAYGNFLVAEKMFLSKQSIIFNKAKSSRKHTYIILTPLNPTFLYQNLVYRGMHYFSYFC